MGMILLQPLIAAIDIGMSVFWDRRSASSRVMSCTLPGAGLEMLTIRPGAVRAISVLMVWHFFLPEYPQRCWRHDRWIGGSVQSKMSAAASSRLTRMARLTPRTRAARFSIRRSARLITD